MTGKNTMQRLITFIVAVGVWTAYSMVTLASPKELVGVITVNSGQVTVNGQVTVSNSSVASGSTIVTATGSGATISLGSAGKLELYEDSNLTLRFTDSSITGILSAGKVNVASAPGVATTITTKDATVLADAGQPDNFFVGIECSHTHVDTNAGLVTMRSGINDKQVAAGTDAIAGNLSQTGCPPCMRPGGDTGKFPVAGLGAGALAAILIALAGGVGTAIILGGGSTITPGGGTTVVSPVR
jgi:hypothetical protein